MAFALDEIFAYGGQLIVAAKKDSSKSTRGRQGRRLTTLHIFKVTLRLENQMPGIILLIPL